MTDHDLVAHIKERQKFHQEIIDKYQACLRVLDEIKDINLPITTPQQPDAIVINYKLFHAHTCLYCGSKFESNRSDTKFCSKKCSLKVSGRKWYEKQKAKKEQVHPDVIPDPVIKDEIKKNEQ